MPPGGKLPIFQSGPEKGSCALLRPDRSCGIYKDRPWFCRTLNEGLDGAGRRRYYKEVADACNELQRNFDIPEEYRVIIAPPPGQGPGAVRGREE